MEWRRKKIPSIAAAVRSQIPHHVYSHSYQLPDVPFRIFGASEKDQFRKPIPGIWTALENIYAESGIIIGKAATSVACCSLSSQTRTHRFLWAMLLDVPETTPEQIASGL